jgi:hypothetical protein
LPDKLGRLPHQLCGSHSAQEKMQFFKTRVKLPFVPKKGFCEKNKNRKVNRKLQEQTLPRQRNKAVQKKELKASNKSGVILVYSFSKDKNLNIIKKFVMNLSTKHK